MHHNTDCQGFIQKFLFGVEEGVALSHTVPPINHEYVSFLGEVLTQCVLKHYLGITLYIYNYLVLGRMLLRIS